VEPQGWNNRTRWGLACFLAGVFFPVAVRVGSGPHVALLSLQFALVLVAVGAVLWFVRDR
jgi:hypothetical protein